MKAVFYTALGVLASEHNFFYERHDQQRTIAQILEGEDFSHDYDLFDTFEGYIWHRFEHLDREHKQFYLA
jgi:hypothetical protein